MSSGILYIMTTIIPCLIKIGICEEKQYQERMRKLENDGYHNITGLKRFFAIKVNEYEKKEKLLKDNVYKLYRIGESELFSLDADSARELLMAFEGTVIYPQIENKDKEFAIISKTNEQNNRFNFYEKGIKDGDIIHFHYDKTITAKVVGKNTVEYQGQVYKLSPLTYKLYQEKGKLNKSGAYQGSGHFEFQGKLLKDLPNIK